MESLTDKRRTYTFYVDDAVLDVFGPQIGAYGVALYALLARHAKHKQSFPSYKHMMKQLGLSRQTITRTLEQLIKAGLITKEKRQSAHGDADTNLYTLLDLTAYHDAPSCPWPHGTSPQDGGTSSDYVPPSPQDGGTSSQGGGVRPVGTGGTSPGRLEGISLKESHSEGSEDPPYSPPKGDAGAMNGTVSEGTKSRATATYPPGFLQFWHGYPHARRASKPSCLKVWHKAHLEDRTAEVCAKVEGLKHTVWQGKEPHYIPMTLTWLSQGRYEDDPITPSAPPAMWAWARDIEEQHHATQ